MIAKFFNRSEPISLISLIILLAILVFSFHFPTEPNVYTWNIFFKSLGIFSFFLLLMIFIDSMVSQFKLTPSNYYALFLSLMFISLFPKILIWNKTILSFVFILWSLSRVLSLRKKENHLTQLFDSGFFLGIAYLIYPLNIFYLLFIYIGYFVYLKIIDKRLLIPLLGFLVPIFLTFTYLFFTDQIPLFKTLVEININFSFQWIHDWPFSIPFFGLGLIMFFLILKLLSTSTFLNLEQEINYKLLIAHLFISIAIVLIDLSDIKSLVIFLLVPSAIIIGNFLEKIKREWLKELLFYSIVAASFARFFL